MSTGFSNVVKPTSEFFEDLAAALGFDPETISDISAGLAGKQDVNTTIPLTEKGAINGVAELDEDGTVPDEQVSSTIVRDTELSDALSTKLAKADVLDEDDFVSNSATKPPSQQSTFEFIKSRYVPARILRPSGDVTGATDTAALLAAAAAGGGKIYLPASAPFYLNDHGYLNSDNLTLEGEGKETQLIMVNAVADKRMLNTNGHHGITIKNMSLKSADPLTRGHDLINIMDGSRDCDLEWIWCSDVGQYGILIGDTAANASGQHQGGGDHRISNCFIDMTVCKTSANPAALIAWPKGGAGFLASPGLEVSHVHMILGNLTEVGMKIQSFLNAKISHCDAVGGTSADYTGSFCVVQCEGVMLDHCSARDTRMGFVVGSSPGLDNGLRNKSITLNECSVRGLLVGLGSSAYGVYSTYGVDNLRIKGGVYDANGGVANALIGLYCTNGDVGYAREVIEGVQLFGGATAIDQGKDAATGLLKHDGAIIRNINAKGQYGSALKLIGDDILLTGRVVEAGTQSVSIIGARPKARDLEIFDGNTTNAASQPALSVAGDGADLANVHIENRSGGLGHMKIGINFNTGSTNARRRNVTIAGMETQQYGWNGTTSQRPVEQRIDVDNANDFVTGPAAATVLKATTIYKGELGTMGGLEVEASGSVSGTANTKTIALKAAGNTIATFTILAAGVGEWTLRAKCWLRNVANSAVWVVEVYSLNALVAAFPDQVVSGLDWSGADRLVELYGTPVGADTINADKWSVKVIS